jgi:hypothetical protein
MDCAPDNSPRVRAHTRQGRQANIIRLAALFLRTAGALHVDEGELLDRHRAGDGRLAVPHRLGRELAILIGRSRNATNSRGGPQIASKTTTTTSATSMRIPDVMTDSCGRVREL